MERARTAKIALYQMDAKVQELHVNGAGKFPGLAHMAHETSRTRCCRTLFQQFAKFLYLASAVRAEVNRARFWAVGISSRRDLRT